MKTKNVKEVETLEVSTNKKDLATLKAIEDKSKKQVKEVIKKERPTTVKEKNFLYKFQIEEKGLSEKDQKKKRNKLRRQLTLVVNKIIISKDKKESIKEFISFYKQNYILNDFTLKSLTNTSEQDKVSDYTKVLELIKESLSK